MLHLKADTLSFTLPGDWSEMTLGQFFAYLDAADTPAILSALSGIDIAILRQLRVPDLSDLLPNELSYLSVDPKFLELPAPTTLLINDKPIKPPTNLGTQTTFGQKADIDGFIKQLDESKTPINYQTLARTLLTTYLYPVITGNRYENTEQAESILPLIDNLPCTQALPLSAFFLTKLNQTMRSGRLSVIQVSPQKKMKPVDKLLKWSKGLVSTIHIWLSGKSQKPTALVP